jgi:hypothetical protein
MCTTAGREAGRVAMQCARARARARGSVRPSTLTTRTSIRQPHLRPLPPILPASNTTFASATSARAGACWDRHGCLSPQQHITCLVVQQIGARSAHLLEVLRVRDPRVVAQPPDLAATQQRPASTSRPPQPRPADEQACGRGCGAFVWTRRRNKHLATQHRTPRNNKTTHAPPLPLRRPPRHPPPRARRPRPAAAAPLPLPPIQHLPSPASLSALLSPSSPSSSSSSQSASAQHRPHPPHHQQQRPCTNVARYHDNDDAADDDNYNNDDDDDNNYDDDNNNRRQTREKARANTCPRRRPVSSFCCRCCCWAALPWPLLHTRSSARP